MKFSYLLLSLATVFSSVHAKTPINTYVGDWVDGKRYKPGQVVSYQEKSWLCVDKCRINVPGTNQDAWITLGSNVMGPQGVKGDTGPQGPEGAQGIQGSTGPQGATGPQGLPGPMGPIGVAGARGPQGPQGQKGDSGERGPVGPVGPQGPMGMTGVQGVAGPKGDRGAQGLPGPQGIAGPIGAPGPQGVAGKDGVNGQDGALGIQGVKGDTGLQGPKGDQGIQGLKGDTGVAGNDGIDGKDGASVLSGAGAPDVGLGAVGDFFIDTANNHFYGPKTAEGWPDTFVAMVGPKGDQGLAGVTGAQGLPGADGKNGIDGKDGAQGIQGVKGDKGDKGDVGATGTQGPKGDTGPRGSSAPTLFDANDQELGIYLGSKYEVYIPSLKVSALIYSDGSGLIGDALDDRYYDSINCTGTLYRRPISNSLRSAETYLGTTLLREKHSSTQTYLIADNIISQTGPEGLKSVDQGFDLYSDAGCSAKSTCITYGATYYVKNISPPSCNPYTPNSAPQGAYYNYDSRFVTLPFSQPIAFPLHF